MSAFARAAAALHRDQNLRVSCVWVPRGGNAEADGVACHGILSAPIAQAFGAGTIGGVAQQLSIDILVADVPSIVRGDRVVIGADTRKVEAAERDVEGLTWRLTLSTST